jgi:pilus assembly protein CpaB
LVLFQSVFSWEDMQRHQVLMAFAVAWLTALGLSYWVYRRSAAPEKRVVARVVAAAKPLPLGRRLEASDLKLITLEQADVPPGAFQKVEDVANRALIAPVTVGDLILDARLAAKGGGDGLTAVIAPGMRAVAVQVNEVSSVAGFIQPGTRVDVLYTRAFNNGDSATKTLLQNVKVIALGREISPAPVAAAPAAVAREARPATVATLMVSQQQAEMLTLAMQRGKIQLALRNPLDAEVSDDFEPTKAEDLGIKEPVRAVANPVASPKTDEAQTTRSRGSGTRRPASDEVVVKVFRGSKLTEESFLMEPGLPAAK